MPTFIGNTYEEKTPFYIGDLERRDGVYVLGRPGTGKSSLLINMAAQDIKSGHGVFFLDPHSDAVQHIMFLADIARRENDIILLDPELDGRSFSINLLQVADVHNEKSRDEAYDRARKFFERLWGKENGLGLYLQSSLDHTLYTFIENQGLTLLEVYDFLTDPAFRRRLVTNMRYEDARFWTEFDRKRDSDQREFLTPLLTRLQPLLSNRSIRRIVGQCTTTVDIPSLLQKGAIILVRLSGNLSDNVREFIGTLLVGELLRAIKKRSTLQESERKHFCVFIDEVQNFTDHDDVAFLFQQARKYGIATTAAHQERRGQFLGEQKILGATDTAGTKIFFRLSPKDAEEQAGEFERDPPKETRYEREMVVSREPVADLLRGHGSPDVQAFTEAFFRPLKERTEDIRAYLERSRIVRQLDMDEAQLWRAAERYASARTRSEIRYSEVREKIVGSEFALNRAHRESEHILAMYDAGEELRLALRVLNKLLAGSMDGTARVGNETFAQRLIELAGRTNRIPKEHMELFSLYIRVQYGEPAAPRAVPFELARNSGLFTDVVRSIEGDAASRLLQEKEAYIAAAWAEHEANEDNIRAEKERLKKLFIEWAKEDLAQYEAGSAGLWLHPIGIEALVDYFIRLDVDAQARATRAILSRSRFTPRWREAICPDVDARVRKILGMVQEHRDLKDDIKKQAAIRGLAGRSLTRRYYSDKTLSEFCRFIEDNREGAIVALAFVHAARRRLGGYFISDWVSRRSFNSFGYDAFNTLCVPQIEGMEPLHTMQLIEKLSAAIDNRDVSAECDKYCWLGEDITGGEHKAAFAYLRKKGWRCDSGRARSPGALLDNALAQLVGYEFYWRSRGEVIKDVREQYGYVRSACPFLEDLTRISALPVPDKSRRRDLKEDFETLRKEIEGSALAKELSAVSGGDAGVMAYLQRRACDIYGLDESLADLTFPVPTLPGRTPEQIREIVSRLVGRLKTVHENVEEKKRRERYDRTRGRIEYDCSNKFGNSRALVPSTMAARPLGSDDRQRLKKACLDVLEAEPGVGRALSAVRELVDFCALLSMRENQLVVPAARMVAKEVPAARGSEMKHEMQRELQGLDPFVAYVSTVVKTGGQARTIKAKLRTPDKPEKQEDLDAQWDRWGVIETNIRKYYTEHARIEQEIEARRRTRKEEGRASIGDNLVQPEPAKSARRSVPPSSIVVKEPQP